MRLMILTASAVAGIAGVVLLGVAIAQGEHVIPSPLLPYTPGNFWADFRENSFLAEPVQRPAPEITIVVPGAAGVVPDPASHRALVEEYRRGIAADRRQADAIRREALRNSDACRNASFKLQSGLNVPDYCF
jgi:hypothetical protein